MTVLIVPGVVGNTNPARVIFDNPFAHGCSADLQSCVPTGALNAQAQSAVSPAATVAQVQQAVPQRELSGSAWVAQFPTGTSTSDLAPAFRDAVNSFIQAISSAGGAVSIAATYRPPERAYLMHYAWKIANGTIQPDRVPTMVGVNIEWDHGQKQSSVNAAKAMKTGYGMKHIAALDSNHTSRTAIDMNVSGMIGKTILSKDGTKVKIKAASDLYPVGASYGVHKLESDPPHWSADGH